MKGRCGYVGVWLRLRWIRERRVGQMRANRTIVGNKASREEGARSFIGQLATATLYDGEALLK